MSYIKIIYVYQFSKNNGPFSVFPIDPLKSQPRPVWHYFPVPVVADTQGTPPPMHSTPVLASQPSHNAKRWRSMSAREEQGDPILTSQCGSSTAIGKLRIAHYVHRDEFVYEYFIVHICTR